MKILSRRQHHEVVTHCRYFERKDTGGGYMPDCDSDGTVTTTNDAQAKTYAHVLANPGLYIDHGVQERVNRWTDPAVGECNDCGAHVHLSGFTNECECGADYNMSGQQLAPREQWGCETGETLADILNI